MNPKVRRRRATWTALAACVALFCHVTGVFGASAMPTPQTPIRPETATTSSAFTCSYTLANAQRQAVQLKQNDTFTINLTGSGCNYMFGPALLNDMVRVTDQNSNVLTTSTISLSGITSITITALYATPTNSYIRFSTGIYSADTATEHAMFSIRTLAGGANIQSVTLSTTGLLGSSVLYYDGDYTRKSSAYNETVSSVTARVDVSSMHNTYGLFSDLKVNGTSVLSGAPTGPSVSFPLTLAYGINDFTLTLVSEDGRTSTDHLMRITRYATITATAVAAVRGVTPSYAYTVAPAGVTFSTAPACTSAYNPSGTYTDWQTMPITCSGAVSGSYVFRYVDSVLTVQGDAVGPDAPTGAAIAGTTLSWTAPTTGINGSISDYIIEYTMNNGYSNWRFWYPFDDGVSTATSANIATLGNDSYQVRIRAVDTDGQGAPSNVVSFSNASENRGLKYTTPGTYVVKTPGDYTRVDMAIVGGGGGGGAGTNFGGGGGRGGFDPSDIFADLFRAQRGGGQGGPRPRGPAKGEDVQGTVTIGLVEAINGCKSRVTLSNGRTLEVSIPAGIEDGKQIRLRGQGNPGPMGSQLGDALVTVKVAKHPYFRIDGRDIRLDLPITLYEAVLGGAVQVPTLSGAV